MSTSREVENTDIRIHVKAFGQTVIGSISEGLERCFCHERLTAAEGNQLKHACDARTERLVDAEKGTLLSTVPYILSVSLLRYEFDWETERRIKLNDRVPFDFRLDLGPLVKAAAAKAAETEPDPEGGAWSMGGLLSGLGAAASPRGTSGPAASADGSVWYELYAVMVQSGGAFGGHYFSFIKDFETQTWHEFNDSKVTEASEARIKSVAFGGNSPKPGTGSSAYMLLYRREDPSKNVNTVPDSEVPVGVVQDMAVAIAEEEAEAKKFSIAVYHEERYERFGMSEDDLWGTVLQSIESAFGLTRDGGEVHRLCRLDLLQNIVATPIVADDDVLLKNVQNLNKTTPSCRLLLETRAEGDMKAWESRGATGAWSAKAAVNADNVICLQMYDIEARMLVGDDTRVVRFSASATVQDLHDAVAELFEIESLELELELELEPEPEPEPEPESPPASAWANAVSGALAPGSGQEKPKQAKARHNYKLAGDAGDVDCDEVDRLLAERMQAKRNQLYDVADELKKELRESHRVFIDDKARSWKVNHQLPRPGWTADDLFESVKQLGLADAHSIKTMRGHLAAGKFKLPHFVNLWDPQIQAAKAKVAAAEAKAAAIEPDAVLPYRLFHASTTSNVSEISNKMKQTLKAAKIGHRVVVYPSPTSGTFSRTHFARL